MNIINNSLNLKQTSFKAQLNKNNQNILKVFPSQDLFIKPASFEPHNSQQISFAGLKALKKLEVDMIFKPMTELESIPPDLKAKIEEVKIKSTDGITLNCWHIEPKEGKPTILFCHGNKVNITQKHTVAQFLSDNGYGVLMADYRGYGNNPGTPSEKGLYEDTQAAVDFLNNEKGIETKDLYIWGHSLGGGVVSEIASKNDFKGVILNSTFTNIIDMTKDTIIKTLEKKDIPLKRLQTKIVELLPDAVFSIINTKFDNIDKIDKIKSPILILHSKQDEVVPYQMSEKLAGKNKNCTLVLSESGLHSDHKWSEETIKEFLTTI